MILWKGEACGNTFLALYGHVDVREPFQYLNNLRKRKLWNFDSALVLDCHDEASVRMRVIEYDGSESRNCGNGLRFVGGILDSLQVPRIVYADDTVFDVGRAGSGYRVAMSVVYGGSFSLYRRGVQFTLYYVSGEPHLVAIVDDVHRFPLREYGLLSVPYANCTIVSRNSRSCLSALTYERGVNRITESCGTGACAAGYVMYVSDNFSQMMSYRVGMHSHVLTVHCSSQLAVLQGAACVTNTEVLL